MNDAIWPWALAALLWVSVPVVVVLRFLDSVDLDAYPPSPRSYQPSMSVIIPARNEARNIEACLRSVVANDYMWAEVVVVDDHSTDGTGDIVRRVAAEHPQVRLVEPPPLPPGWFGKQWACHSGAATVKSELLCFADADTRFGPELLRRSVNAMRSRGADLFSVAGHQEALTFWEKILQPFVFSILLSRYGGLEAMSRSAKPLDKIANGQFIIMTELAYAMIGGHAAVKDHVAEDLRLAQLATAQGLHAHMVLGRNHLRTRMYTSLAEIWRGWGKNVYAAGRDTLPLGPLARRLFPWVFPLPALLPTLPLVCLLLAALGIWGQGAMLFGAVAGGATLLFYAGVYAYARLSPLWALGYPLAALVFSAICAQAAWRGSRVQWKGREYQSQRAS